MEARLTQLNRDEILRYLGYRGQTLSPELQAQIDRAEAALCAVIQPRLVYTVLPVAEGTVKGLTLSGRDIAAHLTGCHEAVLMAVTLGAEAEQLLYRRQVTDMADAVIMDACASAAVENVCDNFEQDLRRQTEQAGRYLTGRFSPGYGDLPLETQRSLCGVLDTARRIGLTVSGDCLLHPLKSVTAILGISEIPQPLCEVRCQMCSKRDHCAFRKTGGTCHG